MRRLLGGIAAVGVVLTALTMQPLRAAPGPSSPPPLTTTTTTSYAGLSRDPPVRVHPPPTPKPHLPSWQRWAHGNFQVRVANCESADLRHWPHSSGKHYIGDAHLRDPNGHYGKWQFAPPTWRGVGGSGNPADATEREQDYRAWLLWRRDGWGQWSCASLV